MATKKKPAIERIPLGPHDRARREAANTLEAAASQVAALAADAVNDEFLAYQKCIRLGRALEHIGIAATYVNEFDSGSSPIRVD